MGKRRIVLFLVIIIFFLFGITGGILNYHYSFSYLYNYLLKRGFYVNPRVEIDPDRIYRLDIWYYPFYKTISEKQGKEKIFFSRLEEKVQQEYSNIELRLRELSFKQGKEKLQEAIKQGIPPDMYINFSNDSYLSTRWQIPVEDFVNQEGKKRFYTVNWRKINSKNHLWGWPFLVQKQGWFANTDVSGVLVEPDDFLGGLNDRNKLQFCFNYYDYTLLRQLLALNGLSRLKMEEGRLSKDTYQKLEVTFKLLADWRQNGILVSGKADEMLKQFFEEDNLIIGPVNLWLKIFLLNKGAGKYEINLPAQFSLFTINIFRQQDYQGHDHTKAAMEVARILCQDFSKPIGDNLKLEPAYRTGWKKNYEYNQILEVTPETRKLWQKKIIPAWTAFWKEDLAPAAVMTMIKSKR